MTRYFLTPARNRDRESATQAISRQLNEGSYSWGERTPWVTTLKPGDRISFYAAMRGVVADAEVTSSAEHTRGAFPWRFGVKNSRLLNPPIAIDRALRSELDAFRGKDPASTRWSWFVQVTREISEHDFRLLTDSPAADRLGRPQ